MRRAAVSRVALLLLLHLMAVQRYEHRVATMFEMCRSAPPLLDASKQHTRTSPAEICTMCCQCPVRPLTSRLSVPIASLPCNTTRCDPRLCYQHTLGTRRLQPTQDKVSGTDAEKEAAAKRFADINHGGA